MEDLQTLAFDHALPLPPKGIALPPPASTVLPAARQDNGTFTEPVISNDVGDNDFGVKVAHEPTTEDKWLNAGTPRTPRSGGNPVLPGRSLGPGGEHSRASSRVPSPVAGLPTLNNYGGRRHRGKTDFPHDNPDTPIWDKRDDVGMAAFLIEKQKAFVEQQRALSEEYDFLRHEKAKLAAREAWIETKDNGSGREAVWLNNSRPGSRVGSPTPRSDLAHRLQAHKSDLKQAFDSEYRDHEVNVRAVIDSLDTAKAYTRKQETLSIATTAPMVDLRGAVSPSRSNLRRDTDRSLSSPRPPAVTDHPPPTVAFSNEPRSSHAFPQPQHYRRFPTPEPPVFPRGTTSTHQKASLNNAGESIDDHDLYPAQNGLRSPMPPLQQQIADHDAPSKRLPVLFPSAGDHTAAAPGGVGTPRDRSASPTGSIAGSPQRGVRSPQRARAPDEFLLPVAADSEARPRLFVRARPSDTAAATKAGIQEQRPALAVDRQRLFHDGVELEDSLRLCDYGVDTRSTLQLLLRDSDSLTVRPTEYRPSDAGRVPYSPAAANLAKAVKSIWIRTRNSSLVDLLVSRDRSEGELLEAAKLKLGLPPAADVVVTSSATNGRVRLAFDEVQVGSVYTVESVVPGRQSPVAAAAAGPAGHVPPPPQGPSLAKRRLRDIFDAVAARSADGAVTRRAVGRALRDLPDAAVALSLQDRVPTDDEVRRTLAALFEAAPVGWSQLEREVNAYQGFCELSPKCWDGRRPWRRVGRQSVVEPTDGVPSKHRHVLALGFGRVLELNHTKSGSGQPEIPVALVAFRLSEGDEAVWIRLTNLRVVVGDLADAARPLSPASLQRQRQQQQQQTRQGQGGVPLTPSSRAATGRDGSAAPAGLLLRGRPDGGLAFGLAPAGRGRGAPLPPTLASQAQRNRTRTTPAPAGTQRAAAAIADAFFNRSRAGPAQGGRGRGAARSVSSRRR
ncbi:hypothetical protein DIPPA_26219 [Diplonema papillatum]|nr:hypothetical protein DIPPA_26219 [Diplonema papillatum]